MELKQTLNQLFSFFFRLLIVPYGIETEQINTVKGLINTFNRTLWN